MGWLAPNFFPVAASGSLGAPLTLTGETLFPFASTVTRDRADKIFHSSFNPFGQVAEPLRS
jgi:hypothetical protein